MIVLISRLNKQASEMRKGKLAPYILWDTFVQTYRRVVQVLAKPRKINIQN